MIRRSSMRRRHWWVQWVPSLTLVWGLDKCFYCVTYTEALMGTMSAEFPWFEVWTNASIVSQVPLLSVQGVKPQLMFSFQWLPYWWFGYDFTNIYMYSYTTITKESSCSRGDEVESKTSMDQVQEYICITLKKIMIHIIALGSTTLIYMLVYLCFG
jgi:hypothetical protein